MAQPDAPARVWRLDILWLLLITALSAAPYTFRLGFYSDDWGLISGFQWRAGHGGTAFSDLLSVFGARPLQGMYLASLFDLFGLNPLGYHLVNAAVLAAAVAAFYLLLVRLNVRRSDAFAAAVVLIFLPQLSTVRVWISASQIPLAMLFMLLSAHAQLSFASERRLSWLLVAIAAAVASAASYETFVPLIAAFGLGLVVREADLGPPGARNWKSLVVPSAAIAALVAASIAYKLAATDRSGHVLDVDRYLQGAYQFVRPDYDWRIDSSVNLYAALLVHFWFTLTGWAESAVQLAQGKADWLIVAIAGLIGAVVAIRLWGSDEGAPQKLGERSFFLFGLAAFVLGHAAYLLAPAILFSPTGIANRALAAAAPGAAIIFVALLRYLARSGPSAHQGRFFSIALALIAVLGMMRIATIESYWAEAPARQWRVLNQAKAELQSIPAGSTVILDGVCPYDGPAVVFEAGWDWASALGIVLGRVVSGDVISSRTSINSLGLVTSIYKEQAVYPFGNRLYVYNPAVHVPVRLGSAAAAVAYFSRPERKRQHCPTSYVGQGVLI